MLSIENTLYNISLGEDKQNSLKYNEEIITTIIKHKIKDPIMKSDNNLYINNICWKERAREKKEQINEFLKVIRTIETEGIEYLVIKGLVLSKYYPKDLERTNGDFDIVIKSMEEYWKLFSILRDDGFEFEYYPLFAYEDRFFGVSKLKKVINEIEVNLEINIGGFAISERTWLSIEDLWENTSRLNYNGTEMNIPSNEMNVIIFIAETMGNKFFRVRDALDLKFFKQYKEINWDFVHNKLRKLLLWKEYRKITNLYSRFESNKYKSKKYNNKINYFLWRIGIDFYHLIPMNIRKNKPVTRIFFHYLRITGDNITLKGESFRTLKVIDMILDPEKNFYLGGYTSLVHITDSFKGEWEWKKFGRYNFVRTPIGVFLASNFCNFDENEIKTVEDLIISIWGSNEIGGSINEISNF